VKDLSELKKFKAVLENGEEITSEKGFAVFVTDSVLDVRFIDMHPQDMMSILMEVLYEVMTIVKQQSAEMEAYPEKSYDGEQPYDPEDHPFLQ
jgi:hypothetical protein